MRYVWIMGACLTAGVAAQAQLTNPGSVDPVALANAISAMTPAPCPVPSADTLNGSAGTSPVCMTRPDASRPTQVQRLTVTTAADGTFSGTWPAAFTAAPVTYWAVADVNSVTSAPYHCSFVAGTVTATAFSGKCWQIVATTLPTTVAALSGLVVSPLQNAAAGVTVRVSGRQ